MMTTSLGKVKKAENGFKVVFERHLHHDIETVWEAITDPAKLKMWFTDIELETRPGGKMKIIFRDAARTVTNGEVISVEKPRRFVWTWEGELAEWELTPEGKNECKLVFTYSKMDEKYAVGAAGGFHTLIERLERALNGDTTTYPFGTEEHDPEQAELREIYGEKIYEEYPELQVHNPIRIQRVFKVPVRKVWDALTQKELLEKWYFRFPDSFQPRVGQEFEWTAGPPAGKQWLHRGKITEVEENKKLSHSWEFPGYSGKAEVSWEIRALNQESTMLNFSFTIIEPFDPREKDLSRKNFVEGWKEFIQERLQQFLEG